MENEKIYGVAGFEKINKTNIDAHIKEFETFDEACSFPNITFIVIKKRRDGENIPGTGLYFPNIFTYKIVDVNKQQYFIQYGNNKSSDCIIKTKRLAYHDHIGKGEIAIHDRNDEIDTIELDANYDSSIGIVKNFIGFLLDFEDSYSSDWKLYRIKKDLTEKIRTLEDQLTNANLKILNMAKKIKDLKNRLKGNS